MFEKIHFSIGKDDEVENRSLKGDDIKKNTYHLKINILHRLEFNSK